MYKNSAAIPGPLSFQWPARIGGFSEILVVRKRYLRYASLYVERGKEQDEKSHSTGKVFPVSKAPWNHCNRHHLGQEQVREEEVEEKKNEKDRDAMQSKPQTEKTKRKPKTKNEKTTHKNTAPFPPLLLLPPESSTLPLSENTPPSTTISQNKPAPRAPLADLDDSLPSSSETHVPFVGRAVAVLLLAGQADDFLAGALDGEFGRFLLRGGHGARRVVGVGGVGAALRD